MRGVIKVKKKTLHVCIVHSHQKYELIVLGIVFCFALFNFNTYIEKVKALECTIKQLFANNVVVNIKTQNEIMNVVNFTNN